MEFGTPETVGDLRARRDASEDPAERRRLRRRINRERWAHRINNRSSLPHGRQRR